MNAVTSVAITVRYAETDQMGVVYHANYLVWCDIARTEYLRGQGISYRQLEEDGLRLAVIEAQVRYRSAATFDDALRIRCWVRDVGTRRVEFGYVIQQVVDDRVVATARTALIALDSDYARTTIPETVRSALIPIVDPVRI
ncbi:MAG TPA: thioesterase family protein [Gemmatimonadales bacterium]